MGSDWPERPDHDFAFSQVSTAADVDRPCPVDKGRRRLNLRTRTGGFQT